MWTPGQKTVKAMVADAVDQADDVAAKHVQELSLEIERHVEVLAMALVVAAGLVAGALVLHAVTR